MEKEDEKKAQTQLTYYGKKAYRVKKLMIRLKTVDDKTPEYCYEDITEEDISQPFRANSQ